MAAFRQQFVLWTQLLFLYFSCRYQAAAQQAFDPRVLAVEISAETQLSPPAIVLRWLGDALATSYKLSRKVRTDQTWTELGTLPDDATSYTDSNVTDGAAYEYQMIKGTSSKAPPYTGYGYIYAGINVPMVESRGTIVLIV